MAGIAYTLTASFAPRLWVQGDVGASDIAIAAVFGSAWQGGGVMTVVPGGWSVSCEAAFYVVLPLALWLIAGRLWRALLLAAASALAALLLSRHTALHGGGTFSNYIHPGIQAPAFAVGGAASVLAQRVRLPRVPGLALALLATAVAGVPFVPVPPIPWGLPQHLLFAPLAAACAALAAQHPPRLLASAPMRRLGEGSYSIYLVHFALLAPSLTVSEWLLPGDGWPTMALHFGLTAGCGFGLACVTYRWIEQPGIRWAARLLRHRTAHADIPSSRRERQASGPRGARVRVGSLSVPRFSSNSVQRAPQPVPAQFTAGPLHGRAGQDAQASGQRHAGRAPVRQRHRQPVFADHDAADPGTCHGLPSDANRAELSLRN